MLRVVLDVNVLVSAILRPGSVPGSVVDAWRRGFFEVVVSPGLLAELREVLLRPPIARYFTPADAEELIADLETIGTSAGDPPSPERLVPRDPDDDYLVALARVGRAQAIVTGDADLLAADVDPPAVSPQDFLSRLERLGP